MTTMPDLSFDDLIPPKPAAGISFDDLIPASPFEAALGQATAGDPAYAETAIREQQKQGPGVYGVAQEVAQQLYDVPVYHLPAVVGQLAETGEAPYAMRDWKDMLVSRAREQIEARAKAGAVGPTGIPGLSYEDIRSLGPSVAFSLASMAAGLGVGVPAGLAGTAVAGPVGGGVAGWTAGTGASGAAAYLLSTNQFTRDLRQAVDQDRTKKGLPALSDAEFTEKMAEIDPLVRQYGLWEAVPEAASNALGLGIISGRVKPLLVRMFGQGPVRQAAAHTAALFGEELATETITQHGQHNVEGEAKKALTGADYKPREWTSPTDIGASLKEVAAPTILQTAILGAGAKAAHAMMPRRPDATSVDIPAGAIPADVILPSEPSPPSPPSPRSDVHPALLDKADQGLLDELEAILMNDGGSASASPPPTAGVPEEAVPADVLLPANEKDVVESEAALAPVAPEVQEPAQSSPQEISFDDLVPPPLPENPAYIEPLTDDELPGRSPGATVEPVAVHAVPVSAPAVESATARSVQESVKPNANGGQERPAKVDNELPASKVVEPPQWAEVLYALPKDKDGHPDMNAAVQAMKDIAGPKATAFKKLTDEQKIALVQRFKPDWQGIPIGGGELVTPPAARPEVKQQRPAKQDDHPSRVVQSLQPSAQTEATATLGEGDQNAAPVASGEADRINFGSVGATRRRKSSTDVRPDEPPLAQGIDRKSVV